MKKVLLVSALLGAPLLAVVAGSQAGAQVSTSAYPSGYTQAQLDAVLPLLDGLKTLQDSRIDQARGRVVVVGLSAVDRLSLLTRLRAAGLPSGVVDYQTAEQQGAAQQGTAPTPTVPAPTVPTPTVPAPALPAVTTLPATGTPLPAGVTPALSGPTSIRAGEENLWSFTLTNRGAASLRLQHGACDVRFEVISAAGEIVRPDPKNTVCTMQLITTDVATGETREVQKIRWEGKNASGQPVPAGTYTLRAVFRGAGYLSGPATLRVTVR